ncbi:MAG: hypothetical protein J1D77_09310 [Muribaculaceae bacterium]|nr:hypothetical protein [Muribaculaceae bacterium]
MDAKHGKERIFTGKQREHVEFPRMPKCTRIQQADAKKQEVKSFCLSYEKRKIIPAGLKKSQKSLAGREIYRNQRSKEIRGPTVRLQKEITFS